MTNNNDETLVADAAGIIGSWKQVATENCAQVFPARMEFREFGVYAAPDGPDIGALWHGGDWELAGTSLRLQAANDEMLTYEVTGLSEGVLELSAEDGCVIRYARDGA